MTRDITSLLLSSKLRNHLPVLALWMWVPHLVHGSHQKNSRD